MKYRLIACGALLCVVAAVLGCGESEKSVGSASEAELIAAIEKAVKDKDASTLRTLVYWEGGVEGDGDANWIPWSKFGIRKMIGLVTAYPNPVFKPAEDMRSPEKDYDWNITIKKYFRVRNEPDEKSGDSVSVPIGEKDGRWYIAVRASGKEPPLLDPRSLLD